MVARDDGQPERRRSSGGNGALGDMGRYIDETNEEKAVRWNENAWSGWGWDSAGINRAACGLRCKEKGVFFLW